MEKLNDDIMETPNNNTSEFGCKTLCFVKTNGVLYFETDKSTPQKKIISELVKGKYYKYIYTGLDSPIYIGKYLRTNNNKSFFQETLAMKYVSFIQNIRKYIL